MNKEERQALSNVFMEAANDILTEKTGCCYLINMASICYSDEVQKTARELFSQYYQPDEKTFYHYWWESPNNPNTDQEKTATARCLALLFAAQIAEEEEL